MVIGAGNLFSAIVRGAFVNSSTELYSKLKNKSKDLDKDRAFNKLFLGGTFGKNIKVGDGDLQTEASIFTGIVQAVADSMNSKDNKNKKDDKK